MKIKNIIYCLFLFTSCSTNSEKKAYTDEGKEQIFIPNSIDSTQSKPDTSTCDCNEVVIDEIQDYLEVAYSSIFGKIKVNLSHDLLSEISRYADPHFT